MTRAGTCFPAFAVLRAVPVPWLQGAAGISQGPGSDSQLGRAGCVLPEAGLSAVMSARRGISVLPLLQPAFQMTGLHDVQLSFQTITCQKDTGQRRRDNLVLYTGPMGLRQTGNLWQGFCCIE